MFWLYSSCWTRLSEYHFMPFKSNDMNSYSIIYDYMLYLLAYSSSLCKSHWWSWAVTFDIIMINFLSFLKDSPVVSGGNGCAIWVEILTVCTGKGTEFVVLKLKFQIQGGALYSQARWFICITSVQNIVAQSKPFSSCQKKKKKVLPLLLYMTSWHFYSL